MIEKIGHNFHLKILKFKTLLVVCTNVDQSWSRIRKSWIMQTTNYISINEIWSDIKGVKLDKPFDRDQLLISVYAYDLKNKKDTNKSTAYSRQNGWNIDKYF